MFQYVFCHPVKRSTIRSTCVGWWREGDRRSVEVVQVEC